jgi:AcrR family transcriptional regulator
MPRAGLTGQTVLAEASCLADELGYDRLTVAALAERFKVASPSLYKHVAGLEAIRSGIAVRALDELAQTLRAATAGLTRRAALDAMAAGYRGFAHSHPGRYAATLRAPSPADDAHTQASDAVLAIVFRVLADYGLAGDDAVDATRALRAALHGFVALEASGGFGMPQDVDRSFKRLVVGLDATLAQWASGASMTRGD